MDIKISFSGCFVASTLSMLLIFTEQLITHYYERITKRNIGEISNLAITILAIFMPTAGMLFADQTTKATDLVTASFGGAVIAIIITTVLKHCSNMQFENGISQEELRFLRNEYKKNQYDEND